VILPVFRPDFGGVEVPAADALAAQIAAAVGQAAVAITFLIGLFRALAQLVKSFEEQPPSLKRDAWEMRKAR
jgi:Pyruvate/2-oxoacid:ferredoxin oxidoreductase gamma subunit